MNELALSFGTWLWLSELDELGELLQAAAISAALLAMAAVATTLETGRKKTTSFVSGIVGDPGSGAPDQPSRVDSVCRGKRQTR